MNRSQRKICGISYYRREHYDRLSKLSVDKEAFSESYEDMTAKLKLKVKNMQNKGFQVEVVEVDLDEMIEWCDARNLTLNPESRTRFAMEKLKKMLSDGIIEH